MSFVIFIIGLIGFGGLMVLGGALWIYFELRKKEKPSVPHLIRVATTTQPKRNVFREFQG